jgi:hypothetical protein
MIKQALEYLNNYLRVLDLHTIYQREEESLNFITSGTPYFDTLQEAEQYCEGLQRFINELETSLILNHDDIANVANVLEFIQDYSSGAGFLPNQGEPLTDHTIAAAEDLLRSHKVLNPPNNKTYEIIIRAIITKTIEIEAESLDLAEEQAHQQFSVLNENTDEHYKQNTLNIKEIKT